MLNDLEQFTQEIRWASNNDGPYNWQAGAFLDSSFNVTSVDGFYASTVFHENSQIPAVFGQSTHAINDKLTITGGLCYTYDEKSLVVGEQMLDGFHGLLLVQPAFRTMKILMSMAS